MQHKKIGWSVIITLLVQFCWAQEIIPFDTTHWKIDENATYVLEKYEGKNAIYMKGGRITAKTIEFENGTIEYDVYLKNEQAFPGVLFRAVENDAEEFYIRAHLAGKPDANQVIPVINGITPWQFYFGPKYSFPYEYQYDRWTHVKIAVNGGRAQVYLDHSEKPHHSWNLFHPVRKGKIMLQAGNRSGMHLADIKISNQTPELINFSPGKRKGIDGLIQSWQVSDKFEKSLLEDHQNLSNVIDQRTWRKTISVEEGVAANISRAVVLRDGQPGETAFARIKIQSDRDQVKFFQFGYSDEVLAILNGTPIYKGNNTYRSRDYRYLGTIGLFDGIYLNLKKGTNTLLMAVSENFGGWLITGKFEDEDGLTVTP
ncbi:MAG: hypothetical protein AAGA77_01295 [Bacteroidota bacterium]